MVLDYPILREFQYRIKEVFESWVQKLSLLQVEAFHKGFRKNEEIVGGNVVERRATEKDG
ncbi:MAG: hypothetical protein ACETWM_03515 [Candidatus Lokiarchaeia archaeon]